MAAPNDAEKRILVEFRNRVRDILKTDEQKEDFYLLRWLRARDLDLDKSEEMLRASFRWRLEQCVETVLDIPLDPFYEREYPFYIDGVDKRCQPVVFTPVGKWDFRKIINEGRAEEMNTFTAYFFESICDKIRKQNRSRNRDFYPITQFTIIVGWNGFAYSQLGNIKAVQSMLSMAMAFEAHYPEVLFRGFYINCPSFFNVVFTLLKGVMAQRTLSKFTIHSYNQEEWKQALLEDIDSDQLSIVLQRL